jgi:hypothetical protein
MEVRLVGVAALRRHKGGAVTGSKAMSCVIETNELRGSFWGEADLGPESRPKALTTPSDFG